MIQQTNLPNSSSPVVSRGSSVVGQSKSSVVGYRSLVYTDITHDTQSLYRLTKPGTFVYFLKNRSGELSFSLECPETRVYIFGIFEGDNADSFSLKTIQKHITPNTESHILIKSVLQNTSHLDYSGNILIGKEAQRSITSLENRNLLVGDRASVETKPFLEILADDVVCHHSATTAPLNSDHIAYLESRGIPNLKAKMLLIDGFLKDVKERIKTIKKHPMDDTKLI